MSIHDKIMLATKLGICLIASSSRPRDLAFVAAAPLRLASMRAFCESQLLQRSWAIAINGPACADAKLVTDLQVVSCPTWHDFVADWDVLGARAPGLRNLDIGSNPQLAGRLDEWDLPGTVPQLQSLVVSSNSMTGERVDMFHFAITLCASSPLKLRTSGYTVPPPFSCPT